MIRVTDLKDRSLAEHNFERVNFMSIIYLVVLIAAGVVQALMFTPSKPNDIPILIFFSIDLSYLKNH